MVPTFSTHELAHLAAQVSGHLAAFGWPAPLVGAHLVATERGVTVLVLACRSDAHDPGTIHEARMAGRVVRVALDTGRVDHVAQLLAGSLQTTATGPVPASRRREPPDRSPAGTGSSSEYPRGRESL